MRGPRVVCKNTLPSLDRPYSMVYDVSMTTTTPQEDLAERWLPSFRQRRQAAATLREFTEMDGVFTAHLLLNKRWGVWTKDVEVVHLDGVFIERDACQRYVYAVAKERHERTGEVVCGGYARHFLDHEGNEQAAVWDDIMSAFPKD